LPRTGTAEEGAEAILRVDYSGLDNLGVPTVTRKTIDCALAADRPAAGC
jgi:hypothetical protein